MWQGKMKAVTFSYDDGVTQDQRFIEILNKYRLKGTFNINSARLGQGGGSFAHGRTVAHVKPRAEELPGIYRGHEVAGHTLNHVHLCALSDDEIVKEVQEDLDALSAIMGYPIIGSVFPYGEYDERVLQVIRERTDAKYSRGVKNTFGFDISEDLLSYAPSVRHAKWEEMFQMAEQFIQMTPDKPQLFFIWGHTYEFDRDMKFWHRMDDFCRLISGHDDIFYGTNSEVFLGIDYYKKGMEG